MKTAPRTTAIAAFCLLTAQVALATPTFHRNSGEGAGNHPRIAGGQVGEGGGLAPTTWGFVSHYTGSLYGTGYYAFRVNSTYSGTNSIYGYTFNYPTYGFVAEIRAIYAFDVSSLGGQPSPVWSSFMFDVREAPPVGTSGLAAYAEINLQSSGNTHHLQGLALFINPNAANIDVYDAEDFENAAPFDHPELAFSGNNPLIGSFSPAPALEGEPGPGITTIDFDVSAAVITDLGGIQGPNPVEIPTVNEVGLATLVALLLGLGLLVQRRRQA